VNGVGSSLTRTCHWKLSESPNGHIPLAGVFNVFVLHFNQIPRVVRKDSPGNCYDCEWILFRETHRTLPVVGDVEVVRTADLEVFDLFLDIGITADILFLLLENPLVTEVLDG